jgi:hypothetical protein
MQKAISWCVIAQFITFSSFFFYGHFSLSPLMLLKSRHSVRLCYICDLRFASFRLVLYIIRVLFTTARERERERDAVYFHSRVASFDVWCPRARVCVCLLMCEADQSSQSRFITLHSIRSGRLFSLMTFSGCQSTPVSCKPWFFGGKRLCQFTSRPRCLILFSLWCRFALVTSSERLEFPFAMTPGWVSVLPSHPFYSWICIHTYRYP